MDLKDAFIRWLEIREDNGIFLSTAEQLKIDADHSSLLRRLVDGGDVFPVAPPRSYSYPWCDLIRNGLAYAFEVHQGGDLIAGPDALVINQSAEWRILERLGEDSFIASYLVTDPKQLQTIRSDYRSAQALRRGEIQVPKRLSDSRWKVYVNVNTAQMPNRQWVIERVQ